MNYIKLRKNSLCVENISALKLAAIYKTPFYCYSLSQLKDNFNNFNIDIDELDEKYKKIDSIK